MIYMSMVVRHASQLIDSDELTSLRGQNSYSNSFLQPTQTQIDSSFYCCFYALLFLCDLSLFHCCVLFVSSECYCLLFYSKHYLLFFVALIFEAVYPFVNLQLVPFVCVSKCPSVWLQFEIGIFILIGLLFVSFLSLRFFQSLILFFINSYTLNLWTLHEFTQTCDSDNVACVHVSI